MIQTVTMFQVRCDDCGGSSADDSEYWAWASEGQAIEEVESSDWFSADDGKHYCPSCAPKHLADEAEAPECL